MKPTTNRHGDRRRRQSAAATAICTLLVILADGTLAQAQEDAPWDALRVAATAEALSLSLRTAEAGSSPAGARGSSVANALHEAGAKAEALATAVAGGASRDATRHDFHEIMSLYNLLVALGPAAIAEAGVPQIELEAALQHWHQLASEYGWR